MNKTGAGKYNRRLTIQEPTPATGGDGQVTTTWATYATVWAAHEPQPGSEDHEDSRLQDEQRWRFVVRSSDTTRAITTKMRCLLGSTVLNISSVRDLDAARREVELLAELTKR